MKDKSNASNTKTSNILSPHSYARPARPRTDRQKDRGPRTPSPGPDRGLDQASLCEPARLQSSPDDIEGWMRLGRSYTVLGQRDKARDAYGQAAEHAPERPDVLIAYAHAIYGPDDAAHAPPPEFMAVMRRLLTVDPSSAEALWFVANDEANSGNAREAREMLDKLLAQMPADAPARDAVQRRIDALRAGPRRPPG